MVANGDLREVRDLAACASQSQCEAFMIGRGAMARPELFAQIRGHVTERMSRPALAELLMRHTFDDVVLPASITDEELAAYYEANADHFVTAPEVRAATASITRESAPNAMSRRLT